MFEINAIDTYKVLKESTYSLDDDGYLIDLYSPIIGLRAVSIYLALRSQVSEGGKEFSSFCSLYQVTQGEFSNALESLEAFGLIKTYLLKKTGNNAFTFALYSPRSPIEFFSNILFIGTLKKFVDEKYISYLEKKYQFDPLPEGLLDVSEKFQDHFNFDLNGETFNSLPKSLYGKRSAVIPLYFDKKKFINKMREEIPSFKDLSLSKDEFVKIARFATLYNYDEETMASFLSSSYDVYNPNKKYGECVDFRALERVCLDNDSREYVHKRIAPMSSEVHGDSPIAQTIRAMDRLSSVDFLSKLQNGGKPASSDLKLIDTLSVDMGLPDNVINALIFYILKMNNNVLNNAYAEKLAGSLARMGCQTALDAFNYLQNTSNGMKKGKKTNKTKTNDSKDKQSEESNKENVQIQSQAKETIDDDHDDYDDFLNSL